MGATIKDVAERVGVSPASVSLVLNNKKCRITDETKQKIFDAAKELNYETKKQKVNKHRNIQGKIIGFVYPVLHNELVEECISGAEHYASVYGYHIIQMYCMDSPEKCIEQISLATRLGVDGLIVFPPSDMNANGNNDRLGNALRESGIPYLLLDKAVYQVFCDFVTADYKLCSGMATNYLLEKGHERIGILIGNHDMYNAQKYIEGYQEELLLGGKVFDENLISYCDCLDGSDVEAIEQMISKGVSAIVSCEKNITLDFYEYARKMEIEIGKDISIISIGGIREANSIVPSLTCIQQPGKQMGIKAVEVIVNRINKTEQGNIKTHYFTPTFIEGNSVKQINS